MMGIIEDRAKAQAIDNENSRYAQVGKQAIAQERAAQQAAQMKALAQEAHQAGLAQGVEHGLAAAYAAPRDGVVVDPRDNVSSEEVQRAAQLLGRMPNMQDIMTMRAHSQGLAQQYGGNR